MLSAWYCCTHAMCVSGRYFGCLQTYIRRQFWWVRKIALPNNLTCKIQWKILIVVKCFKQNIHFIRFNDQNIGIYFYTQILYLELSHSLQHPMMKYITVKFTLSVIIKQQCVSVEYYEATQPYTNVIPRQWLIVRVLLHKRKCVDCKKGCTANTCVINRYPI